MAIVRKTLAQAMLDARVDYARLDATTQADIERQAREDGTGLCEFRRFDAAGHLKSEEDITAYLAEACSVGDPAFIALALGTVARALGMSKIAQAAGMSCEELSEAFSANGNPTLSTLVNATRAMGFEITIKPLAA